MNPIKSKIIFFSPNDILIWLWVCICGCMLSCQQSPIKQVEQTDTSSPNQTRLADTPSNNTIQSNPREETIDSSDFAQDGIYIPTNYCNDDCQKIKSCPHNPKQWALLNGPHYLRFIEIRCLHPEFLDGFGCGKTEVLMSVGHLNRWGTVNFSMKNCKIKKELVLLEGAVMEEKTSDEYYNGCGWYRFKKASIERKFYFEGYFDGYKHLKGTLFVEGKKYPLVLKAKEY